MKFCRYIFNTEGHFLPMSPEISLPAEHCTYAGSFCRERVVGRLAAVKKNLKKELLSNRQEEEDSTGHCKDSNLNGQTCFDLHNDSEEPGIGDNDWTASLRSPLKVCVDYSYLYNVCAAALVPSS